MAIKFLAGQPAAYITEEKTLAIADVQIGLEHELYKKGVVIHAQTDKFLATLDRLIKKTKAERLVVVGDLKHTVPGTSTREDRELLRFFGHLTKEVEVVLVKGNHDTALKNLVPKDVKVHESGGCRIGRYGFFHGHAWPDRELLACDTLLMGHLQPGLEFADAIGHRATEQVWLRCRLDRKRMARRYKAEDVGGLELVIMPAFNRMLGSARVNRMGKGGYRGPFSDGSLDLRKAEVYLLDGTFVGILGKMDI